MFGGGKMQPLGVRGARDLRQLPAGGHLADDADGAAPARRLPPRGCR